jgi:O-antigen ligase
MNLRLFPLKSQTGSPASGQRSAWIQPAIILAVIGLSLLLALSGSTTLILLAFAAVVGIPVGLLFMRVPALGMAAFIVAAFLVPSPIGQGGPVATIHPAIMMVGLMTALWVVDMLVREKRFYFVASSTNVPLFLLMLVAVIALINAQINYFYLARLASAFAQISGMAVFVLSGLAFFLGANQIKSQVWLERITWLYLAISAIYILGRVTPFTERLIRPWFQYGSDASLFWTWLVAIASSQMLINTKLDKRIRIGLGVLLAATMYVSLFLYYDWKSGWLPSLVALGVVMFLGVPRLRPLVILGGLIVAGQYVLENQTALLTGEDYSVSTRVEAWRLILQIVKANPILGLGMSNYYWYTPLFPILGYAVNFNSHNNYIDIVAQTGLVGLGCYLWFAAATGLLGWRLKDAVPTGFARAYVIGALGGLAGMLVAGMLGDWVLPFVYNVGLYGMRSSLPAWFFLGGLVLMEQLYRFQKTTTLSMPHRD